MDKDMFDTLFKDSLLEYLVSNSVCVDKDFIEAEEKAIKKMAVPVLNNFNDYYKGTLFKGSKLFSMIKDGSIINGDIILTEAFPDYKFLYNGSGDLDGFMIFTREGESVDSCLLDIISIGDLDIMWFYKEGELDNG